MITLVTGVIGGGKTTYAMLETLKHLAKGLYVRTNVDYCFNECQAFCRVHYGVEIQRNQIKSFPDKEGVTEWWDLIDWGTEQEPVLAVIDEAQNFWGSRDWQATQEKHKSMLSFLTQSRKAGVNVIFITQDAGNVDKQFRVLAQQIISCRNMANIKIPVIGLHLVGIFRYQTIESAKQSGIRDLVTAATWFKAYGKNKMIFSTFETTAFLDSFMSSMAEKRKRVHRLKLRKASFTRRLADNLTSGDKLERAVGKLFRCLECMRLRRERYELHCLMIALTVAIVRFRVNARGLSFGGV